MILTYAKLEAKSACKNQLELYRANFPDNLKITRKDIMKAKELGLNLYWFAYHFLSYEDWNVFDEAINEDYRTFDKASADALCKALGL